jgi:NTP pyrophosphatase (non-canonical NTP hydrolase)
MDKFVEYQEFVQSMKVYPEKHAIIYPALGISGESGEFAEKVKKWLRGDGELNKEALIKELGDILWYVTSAADDLGSSLVEVINTNVIKLSARKHQGILKGSGDDREVAT